MEKINNIFVKFIGILAIVILTIFTINSFFTTYTITIAEKPIFHIGNFWALIVLIIIFLACKYYISKKLDYEKFNQKNIKILGICLLVLYACLCVIFAYKANIIPRADQDVVLSIARTFSEDNFGWVGTYLKVCPHQYGISLLFYMIEKLPFVNFENDVFIINMLNIFFLIMSYIALVKIGELIQNGKKNNFSFLISLLLFFPLTIYITFVYGNIIGYSISTLALCCELIFFKSKKNRYIIFSIILSSIAIIVKSNFLIIFIAEIILLFFYMLKNDKKIKNILFIIGFILVYIISTKILNYTVFKITGEYPGKGMPKVCWIDMGIEENSDKEVGWYNNKYYEEFVESDYNYELADEKAKNDIKDRVIELLKSPKEVLSFLYRKTMSQWNEPTFASLWICNTSYITKGVHSSSDAIIEFFEQESIASTMYSKYCNVIHFFILFGALCYFVLEYKKLDITKISLILVILGGVAFHTFWEAKSQYTLTYFVLLIPYAIIGYDKLILKIKESINKKNEIKLLK